MLKIVLAEDIPSNRKFMEIALKSQKHEVFVAEDGMEALNLIFKERPQLLICDVQMPRMDGEELIREIRKKELNKDLKTVAVTAHAMSGDRKKFLSLGFDYYLAKPVNINELLNLLKQIETSE